MHEPNCSCPMCALSKLDEGTDWEQSGDLLAANDRGTTGGEEDNGMAAVSTLPDIQPEGVGLDSPETIPNILDAVRGLDGRGEIEELIVIANTPDGLQNLFTTLERNDHIIGMLEVAKMNWHSSQIAMQNYLEEDE